MRAGGAPVAPDPSGPAPVQEQEQVAAAVWYDAEQGLADGDSLGSGSYWDPYKAFIVWSYASLEHVLRLAASWIHSRGGYRACGRTIWGEL